MSLETFELSEWIGRGIIFNELQLPDHVMEAFNDTMRIPENNFSNVFDISATVQTLVWPGNLPKIMAKARPAEPLFTTRVAAPLRDFWMHLPIPPLPVALTYVAQVGQAWLDGCVSATHVDENITDVPLWIVHYWLHIAIAHHCRIKWSRVMTRLQGMTCDKRVGAPGRIDAALLQSAMESFGWGTPLRGYASKGGLLAIDLTEMLHDEWLNDRQVDALYAGLRHHVSLERRYDPTLGQKVIGNVVMFTCLNSSDSLWSQYGTDPTPFKHLWDLGQHLEDGSVSTIHLPMHVNGNHWQAVTIDGKTRSISYGCGLDWELPQENTRRLMRWLAHHGFNETKIHILPHSRQPDDYSCGWIMLNTHEAEIFGDALWLSGSRTEYICERILNIVDEHNQVHNYE